MAATAIRPAAFYGCALPAPVARVEDDARVTVRGARLPVACEGERERGSDGGGAGWSGGWRPN